MSNTILVIEDNEKHSFLFEDMLSDEGYEVETAKDGNEANQKMAERTKSDEPFDLLLVDLAVPDFDPIDFIKTYRNTHRIIVVSAYIDSYSLMEILPKECLIKKPFDTNVLIERVKERLSLPIE
jgi:two-component system response regulator AtoC